MEDNTRHLYCKSSTKTLQHAILHNNDLLNLAKHRRKTLKSEETLEALAVTFKVRKLLNKN